jgi:hypothetical protein
MLAKRWNAAAEMWDRGDDDVMKMAATIYKVCAKELIREIRKHPTVEVTGSYRSGDVTPTKDENSGSCSVDCLVGRRVRLKDKLPLVGWTVSTRNRLQGTVVADKNYYIATVRIEASDSWDGHSSESDHAKTDLTLLVPPNVRDHRCSPGTSVTTEKGK